MVEFIYSTAEEKSERQDKRARMVQEIVALIEQKFRVTRNDKFEHHAEINSDYFGSIKSIMGKFYLDLRPYSPYKTLKNFLAYIRSHD